jgi:hypothetical protein
LVVLVQMLLLILVQQVLEVLQYSVLLLLPEVVEEDQNLQMVLRVVLVEVEVIMRGLQIQVVQEIPHQYRHHKEIWEEMVILLLVAVEVVLAQQVLLVPDLKEEMVV